MKYEKPEVVRVASAIEAVQNPSDKGPIVVLENDTYCSPAAYAANE
jgi:hypothetical protein